MIVVVEIVEVGVFVGEIVVEVGEFGFLEFFVINLGGKLGVDGYGGEDGCGVRCGGSGKMVDVRLFVGG